MKVFPNLQSLQISNCNQLIKAPFNHFSSCLESLRISGCNQLTTDSYLPLLSKLTSLTYLELVGLNGLESLPDELFYNNPNLSDLKIGECPKLREIPDGGSFPSLAELSISECHRLVDFPYEMVESSVMVLDKVVLKGLSSLSNLPKIIECLAKSGAGLRELRIVGVPKFMATSVEVWHFPNLKELEIDVSMEGSRETSVATVDRILKGCSCDSLYWLSLTGMEGWECMLEPIQHLTSVSQLELKNFGMEEIAEWFDQFISHRDSEFKLKLSECKRLRQSPSTHAMQRLIEDKRVDITDCPELTTQSDDCSE